MKSMSVGRGDWRRFAAEFTRQHEGWPLVIETASGDEGEPAGREAVPFRGIALDHHESLATIILGEDPDRYFIHSIGGVKNVVLESGLKRSESSIRLESDHGVTLLHFELADTDPF